MIADALNLCKHTAAAPFCCGFLPWTPGQGTELRRKLPRNMVLARDTGPTSLDKGVFPEPVNLLAAKADGYLIQSNLRTGGRNGKKRP